MASSEDLLMLVTIVASTSPAELSGRMMGGERHAMLVVSIAHRSSWDGGLWDGRGSIRVQNGYKKEPIPKASNKAMFTVC